MTHMCVIGQVCRHSLECPDLQVHAAAEGIVERHMGDTPHLLQEWMGLQEHVRHHCEILAACQVFVWGHNRISPLLAVPA